jgi:hypothetical protein
MTYKAGVNCSAVGVRASQGSSSTGLRMRPKDVDMTQLERTSRQTYCPYKGECAYYSIPVGGERSVNAVWTYEAPYAAVAEIREYLAFYPDRVEAIRIGIDAADAWRSLYSCRKAWIGLARATRKACMPTVAQAMTSAVTPTVMK